MNSQTRTYSLSLAARDAETIIYSMKTNAVSLQVSPPQAMSSCRTRQLSQAKTEQFQSFEITPRYHPRNQGSSLITSSRELYTQSLLRKSKVAYSNSQWRIFRYGMLFTPLHVI